MNKKRMKGYLQRHWRHWLIIKLVSVFVLHASFFARCQTNVTIVSQPASLVLAPGGNATFFVTVNGAEPLLYQWRKEGTAIANETNSTLHLLNVQPSDGGTYSVVVSNSFGSATSTNASLSISIYESYSFTTLAGKAGLIGSEDGTNDVARFNNPDALVMDNAGNLFVAEFNNSIIRKLTRSGTNWIVSTIAGKAGITNLVDGTNDAARFYWPNGIALDAGGNLFVTDRGSGAIRKITPDGTNWVVSTIASGLNPSLGGIAIDAAGSLFFTLINQNTVDKLTPSGTNWVLSTIAGPSGFLQPDRIAVDSSGVLYVSFPGNNLVRKITPSGTNWVVATFAGVSGKSGWIDGPGDIARFNYPEGLAVDAAGNVFVGDAFNKLIRKITPAGFVTTLGGKGGTPGGLDGLGGAARFGSVWGTAVDPVGNIYLADGSYKTIRQGKPAVTITNCSSANPQTGSFGFDLLMVAGRSYRVQVSSNLVDWTELTNFVSEGISTNFSDTTGSNSAQRFYRIVSP